jgi:hypothetical protein
MFMRTQGLIFLTISAAFAQPASWTAVRDTRVQAFSVDVPRGWKAQGGLLRKGPLDPRVQVDMVSPNGRVDRGTIRRQKRKGADHSDRPLLVLRNRV